MALFVVTHRHTADRCPAGDPRKAPMLLRCLTNEHAAKFGVQILAEAIVGGQHSLHLILEATDTDGVQKFMAPFAQGGSVAVLPASPCETVVSQGKC